MYYIWKFPLNDKNYLFYAIKNYHNGIGTWNEFFNDMKLFGKLSKSIQQNLSSTKKINTRVILNTAICLGNVFMNDSLSRLAFHLSDEVCHPYIKTILYFMYRLPDYIPEVNLASIEHNAKFFDELRRI